MYSEITFDDVVDDADAGFVIVVVVAVPVVDVVVVVAAEPVAENS